MPIHSGWFLSSSREYKLKRQRRYRRFESIVEFILRKDYTVVVYFFIMDILSLEEKFCKYHKKLRWSYDEVEVVFNIDDLQIVVSLYYDQELDLEIEKRNLDLFARKSKICKSGWKLVCQIVVRNLQFNYSDVLFKFLPLFSNFLKFMRRLWKYALDETQKELYSFECKECKMISFLDFEKIGNEKSIVFLKQKRTAICKARKKFHEEKIKWGEIRRKPKTIRKIICLIIIHTIYELQFFLQNVLMFCILDF